MLYERIRWLRVFHTHTQGSVSQQPHLLAVVKWCGGRAPWYYNDIYFRTNQINMWERVLYLLHLDIINWIELQIATVNVIYSINNEIKRDKSHWFKRLIEIHKMRCTDTLGQGQGPFISPYTKNLDLSCHAA